MRPINFLPHVLRMFVHAPELHVRGFAKSYGTLSRKSNNQASEMITVLCRVSECASENHPAHDCVQLCFLLTDRSEVYCNGWAQLRKKKDYVGGGGGCDFGAGDWTLTFWFWLMDEFLSLIYRSIADPHSVICV
jgi:hypothetical protein